MTIIKKPRHKVGEEDFVGRKHRDALYGRVATSQGSRLDDSAQHGTSLFDMNRTRQQKAYPFQARNPTQEVPSNRPFFASRIHITSSPTHRHWPQHLQSAALSCNASARQIARPQPGNIPFLPHLAAGGWLNRIPV